MMDDNSLRMKKFLRVAVNVPLRRSLFVYEDDIELSLQVGNLVEVPFGRRKAKGCIIEKDLTEEDLTSEEKSFSIKKIAGPLDYALDLDMGEIQYYSWISKYYFYSLGKLIFDCLPKLCKTKKEPLVYEGKNNDLPFKLNAHQQNIFETIKNKVSDGFSKWLIHGVTGSGKSAIYLKLMQEVLGSGKSVLYLLPEINLTPQFVEMFSDFVGVPVYMYHSGCTPVQKYALWKRLKNCDEPKLIIGVRSALFLPLQKCGLIVVDEEHDSSFKQDDRCPYHARDMAIKKGHMFGFPVVLGSATPSVESYYNFKEKLPSNYFRIKDRVGTSQMPTVEVVNLKCEKYEEVYADHWPLSIQSVEEMRQVLEKGEQVLILINRLGYSTFIQCSYCGHEFHCKNCEISLKYYKNEERLKCRQCQYYEDLPDGCPECSCLNIKRKGFGLEKIMEATSKVFPEYKISRIDRDEVKTFNQLKTKLNEFHEHKFDILIGTQMISKGHNFKNVNLVVVLGIDSQLNFPDFRAQEKAYQLLVQVAGRAGRFQKESKVLVQSMLPESHFIFQAVNNSEVFYEQEIGLRKKISYPPFSYHVTFETNQSSKSSFDVMKNLQGLCLQKQMCVHNLRKNGKNLELSVRLEVGGLGILGNLLHEMERSKELSPVKISIN